MRQIEKILFILLLTNPLITKASSLDINLSCPETAQINETISCQISYTSEVNLNTIIIKYNIPTEITYKNLTLNNDWTSLYQNNLGFVATTNSESKTIASINLKINETAQINKTYTIELNNIDASDTNFNSITPSNPTANIKIISQQTTNNSTNQSSQNNETTKQDENTNTTNTEEEIPNTTNLENDSKLKSLTLSYGTINFKENVFEYKLTVPYNITTINIEATPNSKNATVSINKPTTLSIGTNKITITVTAEDNTTSTYIITIIRKNEETIENETTETLNINYLILLLILIFIILLLSILKKLIKKHSK